MESRHALEIEQLRDVITNNVYWTHLHKCCPDKTKKELILSLTETQDYAPINGWEKNYPMPSS